MEIKILIEKVEGSKNPDEYNPKRVSVDINGDAEIAQDLYEKIKQDEKYKVM